MFPDPGSDEGQENSTVIAQVYNLRPVARSIFLQLTKIVLFAVVELKENVSSGVAIIYSRVINCYWLKRTFRMRIQV